ncbi:MAG: hypothetical protein O8C63_02180 [Candidatus Methanoperedens sp.]|nr:hypothetical protein [Candidatus Methanoperedens sp.]
MKKWLILALLLVAFSAYASSVVLNGLENPLFCANCHASEYKNYITSVNSSDVAHKEKNITCIECHSTPGITSSLAAKNLLIKAQLVNYSLVAFNRLLSSNFTLNESINVSDFSILKANCTKCHDIKKIESLSFNHSNVSKCEKCHPLHKDQKLIEGGLWRRMGEGGHKNLTCGNCHGTDTTRLEELPQCTKCHIPHLKGAQWDRSICLGCHSDPHLPIKNAVFKGNITKEMCAACHENIYQTLTEYNSKHNYIVPACINCHPKHKIAINCRSCHMSHGISHSGSNCSSCHGYVKGCMDCHTNPHAPLSGLPLITGRDQWTEYAKQAGKK